MIRCLAVKCQPALVLRADDEDSLPLQQIDNLGHMQQSVAPESLNLYTGI